MNFSRWSLVRTTIGNSFLKAKAFNEKCKPINFNEQFKLFTYLTESLILAQDERWRRA